MPAAINSKGFSMTTQKPVITILADNKASYPLQGEHGFSCLIEFEGMKPILFDTGRGKLFHNAKLLSKNITEISTVILSHGHYDHTDALSEFSKMNTHSKLVCSKNIFIKHYSMKTGKLRNIGLSDENTLTIQTMSECQKLLFSKEAALPSYGITVYESISQTDIYEKPSALLYSDDERTAGDRMIDEAVISIETAKGLVLITGCCHCGFMNMCRHVLEETKGKHIYAVIGGFHLEGVSQDRIEATVKFIKENNIDKVYPCHCTGEHEMNFLHNALPSVVELVHCGTIIRM